MRLMTAADTDSGGLTSGGALHSAVRPTCNRHGPWRAYSDRYRLLHGYASTFSYGVELSQWPGAKTLDEVLTRDVIKELKLKPDADVTLKWAP